MTASPLAPSSSMARGVRFCVYLILATTLAFLLERYLVLWWKWPSVFAEGPLWQRLLIALIWLSAPVYALWRVSRGSLSVDADSLQSTAAWIVRGAFWSVLLVGLFDFIISLMRVEGWIEPALGGSFLEIISRPTSRSLYLHYPMIVAGFVIASLTRSLGFTWLALLVVLAEFQIVLARFVFSYEQAFMGDLVRFWYAALFIFSSSYTLIEEGHVRVDVFYASFSQRTKAWANAVGSAVFGIPLCLIVLVMGTQSKSSIITSALLSYEISQSGYGLYVKYLMAAFLIVFSLSMLCQFANVLLRSTRTLLQRAEA